MSKGLKLSLGIFYIIILLIFLFFIFSYLEVTRLNEFLYYKDLQINLENRIGDNLFINLLFFFLFSLIWVTLLGFGSPLLLISGILFGKWIGTIISVFSISLGSLILYSIASFFFKDLVHNLLEKRFSNYINIFKKNEFNYFFAFRLVGGLGIPFGFQNILPVIFNIKKINYFVASFFGFIPIFFIWNTIGSGLNQYVKLEESFSIIKFLSTREIYLPIIAFTIFIIISAIIKKKIFEARN